MIPLHDDNPTVSAPFVTLVVIGICVVAFLWQQTLGGFDQERILLGLGVIPAVLFGEKELAPALHLVPAEATLITSMFLHGGWMHLIGNMLYLWIFGNNIEDAMGHVRFIVFYVICGLVAVLTQAFQDPSSSVPTIGASGAVSGVLGAYLMLYPRSRILVLVFLGFFVTTFRLQALYVLGIWFIMQALNAAVGGPASGGVAWWAHIAGFITGALLIHLFKQRDRVNHVRRHRGPWG
jgi:membrane associated rhomboid family serine protease